MKTLFARLTRSGFHAFAKPALPFERTSDTGFDVLGALTIVGLSATMVFLMRLLLAN